MRGVDTVTWPPESGSNATVTVNRTGSSAGTVSVDYATADGSALAGADYTSTSGTLTFADGETTKNVLVPVAEDALAEGPESFTFTLSNPQPWPAGEYQLQVSVNGQPGPTRKFSVR